MDINKIPYLKQAGADPIDSVTEDVEKLSFDIDAAKAVEEGFQLTSKTELLGMRRLLGFKGTRERDEWKRIFYEDVSKLTILTKSINNEWTDLLLEMLSQVYNQPWSYEFYLNDQLIQLPNLKHIIFNSSSYLNLLNYIKKKKKDLLRNDVWQPNQTLGLKAKLKYDLITFDETIKTIRSYIKQISNERCEKFFDQLLDIFDQSWSRAYYLEYDVITLDDIKGLISMYRQRRTTLEAHRVTGCIDNMISESEAIAQQSMTPKQQYIYLGINVKKIYKRMNMPDFQIVFNLEDAKNAHREDNSTLGFRRAMLNTPAKELFAWCTTEACINRAKWRKVFFEDLKPISDYVKLYDVFSKRPLHEMLLFLLQKYDESKAFTKVLENQLLNLDELKLLIKKVDDYPKDTRLSVIWNSGRPNATFIIDLRQTLNPSAGAAAVVGFDSDSERGGNPPRRRTKRRRLNKKKNATIIKKQNVRRRRRPSSYTTRKNGKSNVGTNIQSHI